MNIWFFLWLGITGVILYFMVWNIIILMRQKRAWSAFSEQHKLRYNGGAFSASPEMSGVYNGVSVSLFTGEHEARTSRGTRKLTAIEVTLKTKPACDGGLAAGGMVDFLKGINFPQQVKIDNEKWNRQYMAASTEPEAFEAYLTPERVEAFASLARIKNAWAILIFVDDTALLRLDTPDALDSEKKLNGILNRMVKAARVLEP